MLGGLGSGNVRMMNFLSDVRFREQAVSQMLNAICPSDVIPDVYGEYRKIVQDGIFFMLTRLAPSRLSAMITEQLGMPENSSKEERLICFAQRMPTIHKLGQMIARNRHIEPNFRKWLIRLENGTGRTDIAHVRQIVLSELGNKIAEFSIVIESEILSEASVGTVVAFRWKHPRTGDAKGVFKVLRPGIREYLNEELGLLEQLAVFFNERRDHYPVGEFRFEEIFKDIRDALSVEINLCEEQAHLKDAYAMYAHNSELCVPRILPFSTRNVTAMEFAQGTKVTDADMSSTGKASCAFGLFKAILWNPLFSQEEKSLFHGDPHAGNIYALEPEQGKVKTTLLDWSLAGVLSKVQRTNMLRLMLGILACDTETICEAIANLSEDIKDKAFFQKASLIISAILHSSEYAGRRLIDKAFYFIDQTAVRGIRFSSNLLFFRKAMFTLEGVLAEIDPEFDTDISIFRLLKELCSEELPKRWAYLLFPQSDRPDHYKSLMSNADLHALAVRLWTNLLRKFYCPYQEKEYVQLAGI